MELRFTSELPPHGKTGVKTSGSGSSENWRKAVHVPTVRQPNRGLTDDDPEFTCSVCRQTFPMEEAHRVKVKGGGTRRTGRCVPCARAKQREANDRQAAKRRGPDYVLPVIKDQAFPVLPDGTRQCALCGEVKSLENFYKNSTVKSGYDSSCVPCFLIRKRDAHLLRTYNLTPEKYTEMLELQGGVCAICKQPEMVVRRGDRVPVLSVDHDHACCPGTKSCGECVRQLLCHYCNVTIGFIERVGSVDPFAAYLARHAAG